MEALVIAAIILAGAIIVYSVFVEPYRIRVRELTLSFPNLPPAFDGYTILHVSDFHLTKLGKLERRTMELIGSREVDSCIITGDVTAEPRASDIFRRVCSAIRHRDTMFMVLGNSEHKPWLDPVTLVDALSFDGLRILVNSSAVIERDGQRTVLVGVDDAFEGFDDIGAAFEGVDPSEFIIFLTHCPSTTPAALRHGADLILAGHTHGGQIKLPGLKCFWTHMRANKRLNDGLYTPNLLSSILNTDAGSSALFVNRGLGMSRLRARLLCPPEIAYITLRRGTQ